LEKFSCSNYGYREWRLAEVIPNIAKIGYKGIEIVTHQLGWPMGFHLMPEWITQSDEYMNSLMSCLEENKVQVCCISPHTEFGRDDQREYYVSEAKKQVDLAVKVKAPLLRIHATQIPEIPKGISRDDFLERLADALAKSSDYAKSKGVKLSIETSHYHLQEIPLKELLDAVGSDYLGITWHTTIDASPEEVVSTFGNKIWHLHLSEASRIGSTAMRISFMRRRGMLDSDIKKELGLTEEAFEQALSYVGKHFFMGEGDINFKAIAKALKRIGYSGWWNFEGHWTSDPEADAWKGFIYMNQLLESKK
jgi:sugar phosphate isomerase/epimerase